MRALLILLGALGVSLASARAEPPTNSFVRDGADLFRAPTRDRANDEIREIRRLFHRDVFVETIPGLPTEDRKHVKRLRRRDEIAYFADMGRLHAQAAEMDGILILICRDPKFVQVTVWPEAQKQTFTDADAERLRKLLVHRRYSSGFDQALLDGLASIGDTLRRNLHLDHPEEGTASASSMALVVFCFLGNWLILMAVSSRLGKSTDDGQSGPHPGLLGGMFGQIAALWIYDRLFPAPSAAPVLATGPSQPGFATLPESQVPPHAAMASSSSFPGS